MGIYINTKRCTILLSRPTKPLLATTNLISSLCPFTQHRQNTCSKALGGMIYATHGPQCTLKTALHYLFYRNWGAGVGRNWCRDTLIWRTLTLRPTKTTLRTVVQIWHRANGYYDTKRKKEPKGSLIQSLIWWAVSDLNARPSD